MKTTDAIAFFGNNRKLAQALGVSDQSITHWKNQGFLPRGKAYELQVITRGKLKVDRNFYESVA